MDLSENRVPKNIMFYHEVFPIKLDLNGDSDICHFQTHSNGLKKMVNPAGGRLLMPVPEAIVHMLQRDFDFGGA